MKLRSKESDIEALQFMKDEMNVKIASLEEKNASIKQQVIVLEKNVIEIEESRNK
jgi:hypothetical protein